MSAELLNALLWLPFGIIALIAGLIYCISGYRHGLWRALVSLVAVAASTVLSVLASRFFGGLLAPDLAALLSMADVQMGNTMLLTVANSAVRVVVAMGLFGVLMLIFTPVLGFVFRKILGGRLTVANKGLKWLGVLVGAVSAIAFSLFWLCPIYGTVATAMPVVQSASRMLEEDSQDFAQINAYVDQLSQNPLVQASRVGPVSAVYDGLSSVQMGSASISVVDISRAFEEATGLLVLLENADEPEEFARLSTKLVDLVRTYFVDQDWFYDLYREVTKEVRFMAADSTMEDIEYVDRLLQLADMPKEEFQQVCAGVLDFAKFALEKGVMTMSEDSDPMQILNSGILQEMGRLLNSSDTMVQVKKLAFGMMLEEAGMTFAQGTALMDKYQLGQLTDPAQQQQEAEAMILPGLSREIPPVMAVLRHPSMGDAALEDVLEYVTFNEAMGIPEDTKIPAKKQNQMLTALKKAAKLPLEELAKMNVGIGAIQESVVSSFDYAN